MTSRFVLSRKSTRPGVMGRPSVSPVCLPVAVVARNAPAALRTATWEGQR